MSIFTEINNDIVNITYLITNTVNKKFFGGNKKCTTISKLLSGLLITICMILPTTIAIGLYNIIILLIAHIGITGTYVKVITIVLLVLGIGSVQIYCLLFGIWMLTTLFKKHNKTTIL